MRCLPTEGEVTSVHLVGYPDMGLCQGFAFVTMMSQESADKAIKKYNAYSLAGNELKVNVAKPRVDWPKKLNICAKKEASPRGRGFFFSYPAVASTQILTSSLGVPSPPSRQAIQPTPRPRFGLNFISSLPQSFGYSYSVHYPF